MYKKLIETKFILLLILSVILFSPLCFAQSEKSEQKEKELAIESAIKAAEPKIKRAESGEKEEYIKNSFSTSIGVDNNSYLDSTKKADSFNRQVLSVRVRKNLVQGFVFNLKYQPSAVVYHHAKRASFYDNFLNFNIENNLCEGLSVHLGYETDFLYYHKLKNSTYFNHGPNVGFRMWLTKSIYQDIGFKTLFKTFTKAKALKGDSSLGDNRRDTRRIIDYEIGKYFKKSLLKFSTQYYINDSNYQYFDDYDYKSKSFNLTYICALTDKFSYLIGSEFERKDYLSKPITYPVVIQQVPMTVFSLPTPEQYDDVYKVNAGLFYDIKKNLTISLNWSWIESDSNNPLYEYAGYVTSLGLQYRF